MTQRVLKHLLLRLRAAAPTAANQLQYVGAKHAGHGRYTKEPHCRRRLKCALDSVGRYGTRHRWPWYVRRPHLRRVPTPRAQPPHGVLAVSADSSRPRSRRGRHQQLQVRTSTYHRYRHSRLRTHAQQQCLVPGIGRVRLGLRVGSVDRSIPTGYDHGGYAQRTSRQTVVRRVVVVIRSGHHRAFQQRDVTRVRGQIPGAIRVA